CSVAHAASLAARPGAGSGGGGSAAAAAGEERSERTAVGARPPRPRRKRQEESVVPVVPEKAQTAVRPAAASLRLRFEELDFLSASPEEWRQLLLEQLLQEGLPQEVCDRLEVDFSDSAPGLLAELRGDDAALEAVQVPVVLIHQGVQSESVDATHRDAARCDRTVVSASVVSAMAQLRREWREQWAGHVE
ncbi:unnamed protein product, partial [Effrenium voratum]